MPPVAVVTAGAVKASPGAAPSADAGGTDSDVSFNDVLSAQLGVPASAAVPVDPAALVSTAQEKAAPRDTGRDTDAIDLSATLPFVPAMPIATTIVQPKEIVGEKPADALVVKGDNTPSTKTLAALLDKAQLGAQASGQPLPAAEPAALTGQAPAKFAAVLESVPEREQAVAAPHAHPTLSTDATQANAATPMPPASDTQSAHRAATVTTAVPVPVSDARWNDAFSDRVVWVTSQQVQSAQIHIEPPQLGPIEVHVSVTNDQANLLFNAPHAVARDAIQAALPRLQEMLSEGGLTLGNVSVGAQGSNGQRGSGERRDSDARNDAIAGVGDAASSTTVRLQRALGMVDLFA